MRIRGAALAVAGAIGSLFIVSGCTTADVVTPVAKFEGATRQADTALRQRQAIIDTAILQRSSAAAVATGASPVYWKPGDCVATATRCRLYTKIGTREWPVSVGAIEHGVLVLMAELTAYTVTLSDIAKAKTPAEVETALGQTKAGVVKLAAAVDSLNATLEMPPAGFQATAAQLGPFIDLAAFGLRQYLEYRKRQALTAAVDEMAPLLDAMVVTFSAVEAQSHHLQTAALDSKLTVAEANFRRSPSPATLGNYRAAAELYDEALSLPPRKTYDDLRSAHVALADALHRRDMSFAELWPYLQNVFDQTAKFATLVDKLGVT